MSKIAPSKSVVSSSFPEFVISDEKLKKLQNKLLEMLKDFDFVCKKYGLEYMICGGTLLGAVRHRGFIPWDDDVDVMMHREYYEKVSEAFSKEFKDKYQVCCEMSNVRAPSSSMKIYFNGTKYVEVLSENWQKPHGIFLDVFCIVDVPDSKLRRKIKGLKYDIASKCAALSVERKMISSTVRRKMKEDKQFRKYIKKRRRLGFVASFLPVKAWYRIAKRQLKYKNANSKFQAIPSGIRYNREVLDRKIFASTVPIKFEDCEFPAPVGWKIYLKNLYGDYESIPTEDKRERHIALELETD